MAKLDGFIKGVKIVNVDKDKWDKTNDRGGFLVQLV